MSKKDTKKKAPAKKAGTQLRKTVTVQGITFTLKKVDGTDAFMWHSPTCVRGAYASEEAAIKDTPS